MVGADGLHSAIRRAVLPGRVLTASAMTTASWRFEVSNPGIDCWTAWAGRNGTVLLIPLDGGRVYGYASTTRAGAVIDDPGWLPATFGSFPEPVRAAVAAAHDDPAALYFSAVEEVRADRWSRDSIILLGDAAHGMGPVWAQGAGLALEDALVLADLLAGRSDWIGVGAEFERLRRPRVAAVRAATAKMSRLAALPTWLRTLAGPVLGPRSYREAYGPLREPLELASPQPA